MIDIVSHFIFLFAVIDPIGTIPVFIGSTRGFSIHERKRVARNAVLYAAGVLVFFIAVGEIILSAINIPLSSFQVAGGIILFLFALTMIFGDGKPKEEIDTRDTKSDVAIFPLAIPSLASPGAMLAVVMLTENDKFSLWHQFQTTMIMFFVLVIAWGLMLVSSTVIRYIGDSGASIISRVMGIILASIAVSNVLEGIKEYFEL